jgi:hypothetical protein
MNTQPAPPPTNSSGWYGNQIWDAPVSDPFGSAWDISGGSQPPGDSGGMYNNIGYFNLG